ncbi:MAG TPA: hypothetical protein VG738_15360 [Chitinophagaceae bacterium]|nr:hypothetical protein [Chitinophagaceae bacterium]
MKKNKWLLSAAVIGLLICAALPQLIIYYRGYYYVNSAPALLKYPLNAGCYLGVALLGYWYIKQHNGAFIGTVWGIVYILGGIFILAEYAYHFLYPGWADQTYLNTMSVFEVLASPLPFIIAWLLLYMKRLASQPRAVQNKA